MKVLIIGLGSIAKKHINALRQIGEFDIFALRSSRDAEPFEDVQNVFELDIVMDNIDFVILSNPTHMHATYLSILFPFGKPIFIEKPPIADVNGLEVLNQELENLVTYTACNLRFHPALVFLKGNIDLKRINEVNVYAGSYLPDWRPGADFRKVYSANKEMGGGAHLDHFHEIDYVSWIFGVPVCTSSFFSNASSLGIDAVDYANLLWQYKTFNVSIVLNYYRKISKRQIEVVFQNDIWTVDLLTSTILNINGEEIFKSPFDMKETYVKQLAYFIGCLKTNSKPMNSFKESVQNLKLCIKPDYEIR